MDSLVSGYLCERQFLRGDSSGQCLQQPWAQQILIDLVITLNAYFASEISWSDNVDKLV